MFLIDNHLPYIEFRFSQGGISVALTDLELELNSMPKIIKKTATYCLRPTNDWS